MAAAVRAYVGLGANLGDPAAQIESALTALAALPSSRLVARSRLYRSPPWGPVAQPDYLNAAAALDTSLSPQALLQALLGIERGAGRERRERWGPRVLDLDLIAYGGLQIDEPGLQLPHPRLAQRPFVLLPLLELEPGLELPGLGALSSLRDSVDCSTVQALG